MLQRDTSVIYYWLKHGKIKEPSRDKNNARIWTAEEFEDVKKYNEGCYRKPLPVPVKVSATLIKEQAVLVENEDVPTASVNNT